MPTVLFPKRYLGGMAPNSGSRPVTGHPLCPKYGFVFNNGFHEIVTRAPVIISAGTGTPIFTASGNKGRGIVGRNHTQTTDVDRCTLDALNIFPSTVQTDVTIVHGQGPCSAANGGVNFSAEVTNNAAFTVQIYTPFTDGVCYFDWGGQTNGTNRVSVGGLTFGDDIFAFTTGPRGMEIWQNGLLKASNGSNPSKSAWGVGTENMCWGKNGFGTTSQRVINHFTFVYWKQLPAIAIATLAIDPFCWVQPRP